MTQRSKIFLSLFLSLFLIGCKVEQKFQFVRDIQSKMQKQYDEELKRNNKRVSFNIKVMTYNLNLLNIVFTKTAFYKERIQLYTDSFDKGYFFKDSPLIPDVLFIQEIWHSKDLENLLEKLDDFGYVSAYETLSKKKGISYTRENIGLDIWISKEFLRTLKIDANNLNMGFEEFKKDGKPVRHFLEGLGGYNRGVFYLELPIKNKKVLFGNTHLSPTHGWNNVRVEQSLVFADWVNSKNADYTVFGGDLNTAPNYFLFDKKTKTYAKDIPKQSSQTLGYAFLLSETEATDAFYVQEGEEKVEHITYDRIENDIAVANEPGLFGLQSRLDHIFVKSKLDHFIEVKNSYRDFLTKVSFQNLELFYSDHYAVSADLQFFE